MQLEGMVLPPQDTWPSISSAVCSFEFMVYTCAYNMPFIIWPKIAYRYLRSFTLRPSRKVVNRAGDPSTIGVLPLDLNLYHWAPYIPSIESLGTLRLSGGFYVSKVKIWNDGNESKVLCIARPASCP